MSTVAQGASAQSAPLPTSTSVTANDEPVELPDHVLGALTQATPLARPAVPQVVEPPLTLTIVLRYRDRAGLESFVRQLDSQPVRSRVYLRPTEVGDRFGPSQAEYDAVLAYLQAFGFTLVEGSANRLTLTVQGPRRAAERAFSVAIGDYSLGGHTFHANTTNPRLPGRIGRLIQAVVGLSDLARPMPHLASAAAAEVDEVPVAPVGAAEPQPAATPAVSPAHNPMAIAAAYNFQGTGATGVGQKIGLLEFDTYNHTQSPNDIQLWLANQSLPATRINQLTEVALNGGVTTPASGEVEVLLDVAVVMGMAPGASYILYIGPNGTTSFQQMFNRMVSDNVDTISNSWGYCEFQTNRADVDSIDAILLGAAGQGISVFSSSGDTGADCIGNSTTNLDVPADAPNGISVGGTNLQVSGGSYSSESWWGSGVSSASCCGGFGVSGGGTGFGSADPGVLRPPFQNGFTGSSTRSVPDVAADADPNTGITLCIHNSCAGGGLTGGTSMAAPIWASGMALINQTLGHRVNNLNTALYSIGGGAGFHHPTSMTGPSNDFAHLGLGSLDLGALSVALGGVNLPTFTPTPAPTANPGDNSAVVASPVNVTATANAPAVPTAGFFNTGTNTWTAAAGYTIRELTTNTTFTLPSSGGCSAIAPPNGCNFNFPAVTAPPSGSLVLLYRMFHSGVGFGATVTVNINVSGTPTSTSTPTNMPANSPTNTPTRTPTNTATNTPTNTLTPTPTSSSTNTSTNTPTATPSPLPPGQSQIINFDDIAGACSFGTANPLRSEAQGAGLTFAGGGAVLNQGCTGFGVTGFSGTNFLVFSPSQTLQDSSHPSLPETVTFPSAASQVSIRVAGTGGVAVTLTARDGNGTVVATSNPLSLSTAMQLLSVSGVGIRSVTLSTTSASYLIQADDLSWTAAAAPTATSTPTNTPTNTPTSTPTLTLFGHVSLPAARGPTPGPLPSPGTAGWITELFRGAAGGIAVYPAGSAPAATPIATFSVTTDDRGDFSVVLTGFAPGTYDVGVKGSNTLENRRQSINPSASSSGNRFDFGQLAIGDVNGDNHIIIQDLSAALPLGACAPAAGYNKFADITNSGCVTIADLSAELPLGRAGPVMSLTPQVGFQAVTAAQPAASATPTPAATRATGVRAQGARDLLSFGPLTIRDVDGIVSIAVLDFSAALPIELGNPMLASLNPAASDVLALQAPAVGTATPRIVLNAVSQPATPGGGFAIDLNVDTGGQSVDAVLAIIDYDPTRLQLVDAVGSPIPFGGMVDAVQPARPGTIPSGFTFVGDNDLVSQTATDNRIAYSALDIERSIVSGTSTVGTLYFKLLAPSSEATVRVFRDASSEVLRSDLVSHGVYLNAAIADAVACLGACPSLMPGSGATRSPTVRATFTSTPPPTSTPSRSPTLG
ncbi:MAG: hypothetical protein QOF51_1872 [Chloroflexota bacterium]|nr:hypothetical protein [Chloroflexota bacterium]